MTKFVGDDMHLAVVVGHIDSFGIEHTRLDALFTEVFDEGFCFLGRPL